MKAVNGGFSLIEALVSLLILSIGVLGVCRLQATLWSSSVALHAAAMAGLLARDQLEKAVTAELTGVRHNQGGVARFVYAGSSFTSATSISHTEAITAAEVRVQWSDHTGSHSMALATATRGQPTAADSRWLLPRR
jgi:type IV pilus modification protein PilV